MTTQERLGGPARVAPRAASRVMRRLLTRLIVLAVVLAVAVGLASPLWVRHQAVDAARAAARAGANTYASSGQLTQARDAATAAAEQHHAHLKDFVLVPGAVKVTVVRHAPTLLLDRVLTSWYDVRATASAAPH